MGDLVEDSDAQESTGPGAPQIRGNMVVVVGRGVHLLANENSSSGGAIGGKVKPG